MIAGSRPSEKLGTHSTNGLATAPPSSQWTGADQLATPGPSRPAAGGTLPSAHSGCLGQVQEPAVQGRIAVGDPAMLQPVVRSFDRGHDAPRLAHASNA